uniref:Uncharacterized protein n=1 Tax=Oryza glaberrima TaxID=4538 RepID=A0A679BCB6_ORYGL|nr:hypothetical protein [Oryza glaberrima]
MICKGPFSFSLLGACSWNLHDVILPSMPNSSLGEGVSGGDGARRRLEAIEKSFSLETVKDIVDAMLSDASLVLYFQISGHATISYALAFNHAAACPRSNRGAVPRTSSPFPPSNTAVVARSSARAPRCRRICRPSLLVVEPSSNPPCRSGMQKLADELDSEQLGLESKIMTIMNLEDPHPYPQ